MAPSKSEDPIGRRIKAIEEKIDQLDSRPAPASPPAPSAKPDVVPHFAAVDFAAEFILRVRRSQAGFTKDGPMGRCEVEGRPLRVSEEEAVDAAADLLRTFFGQHVKALEEQVYGEAE